LGAFADFIPLTGQFFIEVHEFREDIHQLIAVVHMELQPSLAKER